MKYALKALWVMATTSLGSSLVFASQFDIGVYSVGNFGSCANDLANTYADAASFAENRPNWMDLNFHWHNEKAARSDFSSGLDWYASSNTQNSFDGVDSVVIAYVSSHGNTSNNVYSLSVNERGNCTASSNEMKLGDQRLRYLFLSTCHGLLTGPGDGKQPSQPGVDPEDTWRYANKGLQCIFGYSTISMDYPNYGEKFWRNWNQDGSKNYKAFLNASWELNSTKHVPVVMCFGSTRDEATRRLYDSDNFSTERVTGSYTAKVWYEARPAGYAAAMAASDGNTKVPTRLHKMSPQLQSPPYADATWIGTKGAAAYRGADASDSRVLMPTTYGFRFEDRATTNDQSAVKFDDDEAITKAQVHLESQGLWREDLSPHVVRVEVFQASGEAPVEVEKAVEFQQKLPGGLTSLDGSAKATIAINSKGEVRSADIATVSVGASEDDRSVKKNTLQNDKVWKRFEQEAKKKWPHANPELLSVEAGYVDDGSSMKLVQRATFSFGPDQKEQVIEWDVE